MNQNTLKGDGDRGSGVSRLVPVVNKLREAFAVMKDDPIDLPMIAVVGSQSAGKSSVLENIVGHSFLPRGAGIVTRCPCEIRMHNVEGSSYACFPQSPDPSKRFADFNEVRKMIEAETFRLAGAKGLSNVPILLDIYSPDVLDLTLVDLPGAVRNVGEGQDPGIIDTINAMILKYVSQPNCIILAVSAANTDLANSDAIAYSRRADPEGERTLAVLTKLDLMDEGTDARGIITGQDGSVPKLKLGYIGVVNRSQRDITDSKSIGDARRKEREYFANHPAYRSLTSQMGTTYLVEQCSQLLMSAIQREMPMIDAKLKQLIEAKERELRDLPDVNPHNMRVLYQQLVRQFEEQFGGLIRGDVEMGTAQLEGGARIKNLFDYKFQRQVMSLSPRDLSSMDHETLHKLRIMIKNKQGISGGLNTPNDAFHTLVRQQVEMTEGPSLNCAMDVLKEMQRMQQTAMERVKLFESFPKARAAMIQTTNDILNRQHALTVDHLKTLVRMNMRRISYEHPDFHPDEIIFQVQQKFAREKYGMDDSEEDRALMRRAHRGETLTQMEKARVRTIMERRSMKPQQDPSPQPPNLSGSAPALPSAPSTLKRQSSDIRIPDASPAEELEIEKLLALTRGYFYLVQKQVVDLVPKCVELLLVEESRAQVFERIEAVTDAHVQDLMSPSDNVRERREETALALQKLKEALELLRSISRMDAISAAQI